MVAQLFARDTNHASARRAVVDARQRLIVAAPSMVELSFLLIDRLDYGPGQGFTQPPYTPIMYNQMGKIHQTKTGNGTMVRFLVVGFTD